MLDLGEIYSLTDFQRHTKEFCDRIEANKKPLILTVNGKAKLIIQEAKSYQQLLERLDYAESVADIRQGIAEFDRGEGKPASEVLRSLREKHGISS